MFSKPVRDVLLTESLRVRQSYRPSAWRALNMAKSVSSLSLSAGCTDSSLLRLATHCLRDWVCSAVRCEEVRVGEE